MFVCQRLFRAGAFLFYVGGVNVVKGECDENDEGDPRRSNAGGIDVWLCRGDGGDSPDRK